MNDSAEYVSPGHPDRLADAIAEGIVTAALRQKPDSLVGVEVAVHRSCVFIDGRIATGPERVDVDRIVRETYQRAGYGGPWVPGPGQLRITTDLCEEELPAQESDIRPFSDDQNIVIGYACGDQRTNHLPLAHWVAGELGRRLFATLRGDRLLAATFGPDFKILASLEVAPRKDETEWRHLIFSVQHRPGLSSEAQHRLLLPIIRQILANLEAGGLPGLSSTFSPEILTLNGAGEFATGGPEGDNGLSGKKLVIDHYGPSVPIGGGALSGKDPHKVDKCGALRARQLAKQLVRSGVDEARLTLGWAPGGDSPFLVEAVTARGGVNLRVPREELPPAAWFTIGRIVRDLELEHRDWVGDLLAGYFCQPPAPWER
jgi:S-adenosylmethionine synthetase